MAQRYIEVKGINELINRLDSAGDHLFGEQLMGVIGEYIMFNIKKRTAKGESVTGKLFKPYSKRYALFRKEEGHTTDKVNLFFSGAMMGSMTFDQTPNEVKVYFMNTTDKSGVPNPAKAFYLNKDRKFFAISTKERRAIIKMVTDHIRDQLAEGNDGS